MKLSTTFPNATQSFKKWKDLTSAQLTAYVNYINALNQGNWAVARNIFQNGGLSYDMLPTAEDFNQMCDTILECKELYEAPTTSAQGIQDFMGQFAYKGMWSASNISQYKKFSIVRYANQVAGNTYLYIAIQDVTTTTDPYNNSIGTNPQWLRLIASSYVNTNSTYKGTWSSAVGYVIGDVVLYNDVLYLAVNDSTNQTPSSSSTYWSVLIDFVGIGATSVLSSTQPANLNTHSIWFKTL